MKLCLYTLNYIKHCFELHSDSSTKCNGYNSLVDIIEREEKQKVINVVTKDEIEKTLYNSAKVSRLESGEVKIERLFEKDAEAILKLFNGE